MAKTTARALFVERQSRLSPQPGNAKSLCSRLHAECDVAALVYGSGEEPDKVLSGFLSDLHTCGFHAVGILQRRRASAQHAYDPVEFYLAPGDREDGFCCGGSCSSQLQELRGGLLQSLDGRPDIIVLNRFGSQELCGCGLVEVLNKAIDQDVPVLIAVPDALFRSWLSVVQGLAVKLPCNRGDLDHWWKSVQPGPAKTAAVSNFCERFK